MKKFNIDYLLFFICLFFLNTKCFAVKLETKDSKLNKQYQLNDYKYQENVYKNSFISVFILNLLHLVYRWKGRV